MDHTWVPRDSRDHVVLKIRSCSAAPSRAGSCLHACSCSLVPLVWFGLNFLAGRKRKCSGVLKRISLGSRADGYLDTRSALIDRGVDGLLHNAEEAQGPVPVFLGPLARGSLGGPSVLCSSDPALQRIPWTGPSDAQGPYAAGGLAGRWLQVRRVP